MFIIYLWKESLNCVQSFDIRKHHSPQDRNLIWIDTEAGHLSNTPKKYMEEKNQSKLMKTEEHVPCSALADLWKAVFS